MQLTATIRTRPDPTAMTTDGLEMDTITVTAPDYDTALDHLNSRVPDGWQKLSVRAH